MQVAIVTGGSSGIGRSAAILIAARGTGVILTYRSSPERALETVRIIEKEGGTAVALPLDVGRTESFPAFRQSVVAALRGAVVNTSSGSALPHTTEPGYSAYATMKGGLNVMTRYLAKELAPRGIRVNAVAPGSTRTRLADNAFERFPEVIPALAAKTALGRVGEPDDVGTVIATLLGDEGRWITAQTIEVSGGFNL